METEKVEIHSKEVEIKMMFILLNMPLCAVSFTYAVGTQYIHIYTIYSYLLKTHNKFSLFFSASVYVPVGTNIYVIHCLFYVVLSMSVSKSVRVEDGCVLTFLSASRISKEKKNCNSRSGFPGEIAKVIVAQRQIHTYLQCMSNEHTYKKHNHTYTHGDVAAERRTSQCGSGAQTQTGKAGLAVCLSSTDNFGYVD